MKINRTQIAYRCPGCGSATIGFLGGLTAVSDMLRLKCTCGASGLDIEKQNDGKIHLSVPCVYCNESHGFVIGAEVVTREDVTKLSCPFSAMDVLYIGPEDKLPEHLEKSARELSQIMASLDAEELKDIQPQDINDEDAPPDPAIFDTLNFVVKDMEADNKIVCPCGRGSYELRFTDDGMEVYCPDCGASYRFYAKSVTVAEEYLTLDKITLK